MSSRNFWAIAVWWAIILVVALDGSQEWSVGAPALVVGGLLSAFALVTLLSVFWGDSAERAVNEFNRAALYVGVFVLVSLFSSRLSRARWCDGFAIGICGVVVVSLISRFAPDAFSDRGAAEVLPGAVYDSAFRSATGTGWRFLRLLPFHSCSGLASTPGRTIVRAAAVTLLPAIATVIYLASSRGGYAAALLGAIAFLVFSRERWWPPAAIAAGALGSTVSVAGVAQQSAFVNMPTSSAGRDEASAALFSLALGCLAAGLTYGVLIAILRGRRAPGRRIGIAAVSAVGSRSHRGCRRHRSFGALPSLQARSQRSRHSDRGLRAVAPPVRERQRPLAVLGVRSGRFPGRAAAGPGRRILRGLVGRARQPRGVRPRCALVVPRIAGRDRCSRRPSSRCRLLGRDRDSGSTASTDAAAEALDLAAPTAVFVAFTAAAAIDWMWEMTVVSAVAFSCLALMVHAVLRLSPVPSVTSGRRAQRRRRAQPRGARRTPRLGRRGPGSVGSAPRGTTRRRCRDDARGGRPRSLLPAGAPPRRGQLAARRVPTRRPCSVLEDVHWMDDASSELLRHLGTQLSTRPWLTCTTRKSRRRRLRGRRGHAAAPRLSPCASSRFPQTTRGHSCEAAAETGA